jgi:hypothetical protein
MGKINIGRVILGGLVAGIVSDLLGYLVDGVLLAQRWSDGMGALAHPDLSPNQWIWFNLFGLAAGIVLIWIYAAIRPRFGAGPRTIVGVLIPNATFMVVAGLFSKHLALFTTSGALIEILAGALAGAALYKE